MWHYYACDTKCHRRCRAPPIDPISRIMFCLLLSPRCQWLFTEAKRAAPSISLSLPETWIIIMMMRIRRIIRIFGWEAYPYKLWIKPNTWIYLFSMCTNLPRARSHLHWVGSCPPTPPSLLNLPARTCVETLPCWEPMWQYLVILVIELLWHVKELHELTWE